MAYSIEPDEQHQYILVNLTGRIARKGISQLLLDLNEVTTQLNIQRYLVDLTEAERSWSIVDDYEIIQKALNRDLKFDRYGRYALLVPPEDHSQDFIVVVAKNIGINVRLFRDRQEAVEFLIGKKDRK